MNQFWGEISKLWRERPSFEAKALLTLLGLVFIVYYLFEFLLFVWKLFRLYFINQRFKSLHRNFKTDYGQWAVITGASAGIGLSFAKQLARRGMSIIIIGHLKGELEEAKLILEQEENAGDIQLIVKDFSDSSLASYDKMRGQIDPDERNIGVLLNNVGQYLMPGRDIARFAKVDESVLQRHLIVNDLSPVLMTRMILPGMLKRQRGLIVNVSSMASGLSNVPFTGIYGPTKTFIDSFSAQLQKEYWNYPIDIVNLNPGGIMTAANKRIFPDAKASWILPTSGEFCERVINALASKYKPSQLAGMATHEIFNLGLGLVAKIDCSGELFKIIVSSYEPAEDNRITPAIKRKALRNQA